MYCCVQQRAAIRMQSACSFTPTALCVRRCSPTFCMRRMSSGLRRSGIAGPASEAIGPAALSARTCFCASVSFSAEISGIRGFMEPPDLAQRGVDLIQRRRTRAKLGGLEPVERLGVGVEVGVEVLGVGLEVEKPGEDFALLRGVSDVAHRADFVRGIVLVAELAQLDDAAVVLDDFGDRARVVLDGDGIARGPEV